MRMECSQIFRLLPTTRQRERLGWQKNTVRQVYNYALHRLDQLPEREDQTVRQRVWQVRDELPDWKYNWNEWSNVYTPVLQAAKNPSAPLLGKYWMKLIREGE
jgi:putative transposase